jgi:hypothetical protein
MSEHRTSIQVAIITVAGAIIPILVTSVSSWLANTPSVNIEFIPYSHKNTEGAEITLTNSGFGPATNLMMVLEAPGKIGNYINKFSTVEVQSVEINNSSLEAHIPKLVQGSGSIVKLDLSLSQNQSTLLDSYSAYMTYDQGSKMVKILMMMIEIALSLQSRIFLMNGVRY